MRKLIAGCLMVMLSAGVSGPAAASAQMGSLKKAGEAATEAGKATGEAAKDVGKATVETTEKGAKATKKTVTGKAHATCVDGTRQARDTEAAAAAACAKHGGVAKR
jgi:hypothetical protein